MLANKGYAQNPTVINDSLVVVQRIYAQEKLVVDQQAKFKQDIIVQGDARMKSDVRIDSVLRVDGTAKFLSNVKMEGLAQISAINDSTTILVKQSNGQLKTVGLKDLIIGIYSKDCGDPVPVPNPIWANGINKLFVNYCDQVNVGIGTNNPQYILDVKGLTYLNRLKVGSTDAIDNAMINGYDVTNSRDLIQLGVHNTTTSNTSDTRFLVRHNGSVSCKTVGANTAFEVRNGSGHAVIIFSNSGNKILQLEDGGLMRAREIKVDSQIWPDYVFEKNYKLPSLNEVAKFIDKNHHLPGVPSAKEIESDGLNLGDMQKIQMQKIEELTLYMIQMEQRIQVLEKENEELRKFNK